MELILVILALIGGILIGIAVGRRSWLEGWAAGRRATVAGYPYDPSDSEGA